jgi:hypothetical protein
VSAEDERWKKAIEARCSKLEATVARLVAGLALAAGATSSGPAVATAQDLDGPYGNPNVVKDPPRWRGARMVGKKFSETSPEYLDEAASFFDWLTDAREKGKPEDREKARYSRADAARARGWAKRLEAGWKSKTLAADQTSAFEGTPGAFAEDDKIPF